MADTTLTKPDAPERNALIPLPTDTPDLIWQEAAQTIAALYTDQKPPFPHCGRGSLLEDANLISHLLNAVDDGLSPGQAANSLGIKTQTVSEWVKRGHDEPNSAFALLEAALKSAQDRRRRRLLNTIGKASEHGPQHWTAAAWLLERGYGNDYKLAQDKTGGQVIIQVGIKADDVQLSIAQGDSSSTPVTVQLPE